MYLFKKFSFSLIPVFFTCVAFAQPRKDTSSLYKLGVENILNSGIKVATASKKEESISEAPGIISVITAEEIKTFGGNNLWDVVQRATGLQPFSGTIIGQNNMMARGESLFGHLLLLIDGRPMRDIGLWFNWMVTFYGNIPLKSIKRIEVIRGPGSVLYGSTAFTAVINVITYKSKKKNGVEASLTGGSFNSLQTNVSASYASKNNDFRATANFLYFIEDGWKYNSYNVFDPSSYVSENAAEENFGFQSNIAYKGFSLNTLLMKSRIHVIESGYTDFNNVDTDQYMVSANYETKISNSWSLDAHLTASGYNVFLNHSDTVNKWLLSDPKGRDYRSITDDVILEVNNAIQIGTKVNVMAGGQFSYGTGLAYPKDDAYENFVPPFEYAFFTGYIQADYKPTNFLKVILGGQYNQFQTAEPDFVPRIGLIANITPKLGIKLLNSSAFRAPLNYEKNSPQAGNPDLRFEKVNTTDIQLFYQSKKFQFFGTYFLSRQKDLIFFTVEDPAITGCVGDFCFDFVNVAGRTIQGLEFETKFSPAQRLLFQASLTYVLSIDSDNATQNLTLSPDYNYKIGVSYKPMAGLSLGAFHSFFDKFGNNGSTNRQNPESEAHHLLSLNINMNFKKLFTLHSFPNLSLNIYGQNLLDEQVYSVDNITQGINTLPDQGGRAIYAKLSIRF